MKLKGNKNLLVLTVLAALTGCGVNNAPIDKEQGQEAIAPESLAESVSGRTDVRVITSKDNGRSIELSIGQQFVVELKGTPSTGYIWELTSADSEILQFEGASERALDDKLGSPRIMEFKFRAVAPGEQTLSFAYRRPWERSKAPAREFIVTLIVSK